MPSHWDAIRATARCKRADVLDEDGDVVSSADLLTAADALTGLERVPRPAGDPLLYGGDAVLDLKWERIWFNQDVEAGLGRFYQVHEYAHYWLHQDSLSCSASVLEAEATESSLPLGVDRVEGYGPMERREREANVFAREFLLPTDALRDWYRRLSLNAFALAQRLGLPEGIVVQQLSRALLTPELAPVPAAEPALELSLDETQRRAAQATSGPLLVRAGPGTGKTRTLVGRVEHLLAQSVPASDILALTFSNRAAEEMRSRIARVAPEAAPKIWMGTFHAFGLELLRKYGTRLGLPPRPGLVDPIDAVALLERGLTDLHLDHYQNLYEPTLNLRDLLRAISRAKDELTTVADYQQLAEAMASSAADADASLTAAKALDVARVYAYYQAELDREHLLDFGDLIFKAVDLLRAHPDVRDEVRRRYRHVLVDEYQDVNRASGLFLREISGGGDGLWVVGDERQAIYRFRGASPANMQLFPVDFPGASVISLGRNYRSQPVVLDVFSALAPRMLATAGQAFEPWAADRCAENGQVRMEIATDLEAEGAGIAAEIKRQVGRGVALRDQAVLCRSHTTLARIAAELEAADVPILYLGDLFERPEIRDMLSRLALTCQADGRGLVRVARFPEYAIPLADIRGLLAFAREKNVPFPRALRLARGLDSLSPDGRRGLLKLERHLDGLTYGRRPWQTLTRYLFERSRYLDAALAADSVASQQQRLALYQFLQFAHELRDPAPGEEELDSRRRLLRYVRRLEFFGEEKQLRQIPAWADGIDAVRLLTVHASKGLEFRAVYLPGLARGSFPAKRQRSACPPPTGMIVGSHAAQNEEEECLFFVALSRARDVLCLSRARRYGKQNSTPSELLSKIAGGLPHDPAGDVTWPGQTAGAVLLADPPASPLPIDERQLDVYMRCPRQFYYEFVLGLSGTREDSAYIQFHGCVYSVLRWMQQERAADRSVALADAVLQLDQAWQTHGPTDHPYALMYYATARAMVERWAGRPTRGRPSGAQANWIVDLPHGSVSFVPDHIEQLDDGTELVERLRTGRPTQSESKKDIYALYVLGARQAAPNVERSVQLRYLSNNVVEPIELKDAAIQTRLGHYDQALVGILRGEYPPDPNDRVCPRCPNYFICPAAEDGQRLPPAV
jgi:DNA helicase II / ATP-dependent DNA helicase PcrA